MLNDDVITLYDFVKKGTYVYVYNSETSYSNLLDLENQFASNGTSLNQFVFFSWFNLFFPPVIEPTRPKPKTKDGIINSLAKGTGNCYTTNGNTLTTLRSGDLGLTTKVNTRRTKNSVVVPSTHSVSLSDIYTIAQDRPNNYRADNKFLTAIPSLYNLCAIYGVDPIFILAFFKREKSMYNMLAGNYNNGELTATNNPSGIKATNGCACGGSKARNTEFCVYPTLDAGFEATLINLKNNYSGRVLSTGSNKNRGVAEKWNPGGTPSYGRDLVNFINQFYGYIN